MALYRGALLSFAVLVGFCSTVPAQTQQLGTRQAKPGETCSFRVSTCLRVNCPIPSALESCIDECARYRNVCVRTGVWKGRDITVLGVTRE